MGLSIAIMGGIVSMTLLAALGTLGYIFTEEAYEIGSTSLENKKLSDAISRLNMKFNAVDAAAANDLLNFTLSNNGIGKFWNYENFDVIIEYDANIGGVKTKTVEHLVFDRASSFLGSSFSVSSPPPTAIEFDNVTPFNGVCGFPAVSECSFPHEVGVVSGSERIIIVGISPKGGNSVTSVEYNNLVLEEIRSDDDGGASGSALWYRLDPPVGTFNVDVQLDASGEVVIGAISLNDVNQADPIGADNGNTGTDDTPTVDVVTTVDDSWVVDIVGTKDGPMTTGQTEQWDAAQGSIRGAGSTEVTTTFGSYTMSWTNTAGSKEWSTSASEIKLSVSGADGGITCNTNAFFDANDWIIGGMASDIMDPLLINTGEVARICTKLSHPIFANGDVQISVSTDLGHSAIKSVTVT